MTLPAVTAGIGSFFAAMHLVFWISAELSEDNIDDCKKSLFSALLAIIFLFTTIWSLPQ